VRIAISTGGGDAPGLNAVIRAVVLSAHTRGWRSYGILRGYEGLLTFNGVVPLGPAQVRGITHLGGTILGTTNRGNPFRYVTRDADGTEHETDRSDDLVAAFQASGFDALVSIGGDGSLLISHQLWRKGLPVVCVPKTIDNDVSGTQRTFGFDTAVSTATEALDKLHSTAESHDRVMVVELMGRYAGWIALYSGLSGSADVILLPEIPFDMEKVCEKIRNREAAGRRFSIVVVAEGARPRDGAIELVERRGVGTVDRLGGIASKVARFIEHHTGKETRTLVLGHLQRGGSPTTYDRLLALRFGAAAVRAIADRAFGTMVGLNGPDITRVSLDEVVGRSKNVPLDSDTICTARELGISLGD
jgi:ATP-dependent phosphofructokinase / diphosphate-dependent phosphofructokinase